VAEPAPQRQWDRPRAADGPQRKSARLLPLRHARPLRCDGSGTRVGEDPSSPTSGWVVGERRVFADVASR
jgi:hypothetical protein